MDNIWKLVIAIISSTTVATLIQFFVTRNDNRRNFAKRLDKIERDEVRTQLLVLILMCPEETKEILTVGEHYFKDLKGDWYMTSIFNKWLIKHGIARPEWFKGKED